MYKIYRLGLILALLLVSACSGTTFIYNRLDFFIPWYLDDYVELNRAQKASLDDFLQPYLIWHREQELPRYLDTVRALEQRLDTTIEVEHIAHLSQQFEQAWVRLESASLKWMMPLGDQLSRVQIEEFLNNLQKQQSEYEEEFLPRTEQDYVEQNYENLLDSFQDYLGRLNKKQREILRVVAADFQRFDTDWLLERASWLVKLEKLLHRETGWQQRLLNAIALRKQNTSKEYLARYDYNMALVHQSIADILNSRSEKQDRRLRRKLQAFADDLQVLISAG